MASINSETVDNFVSNIFNEKILKYFNNDLNPLCYYIFVKNSELGKNDFLEKNFESFKFDNKTTKALIEELSLKDDEVGLFAISKITDIAEQPWITLNITKQNLLENKNINLGFSYPADDSTKYKSKAKIRKYICSIIQPIFDFSDEQMKEISNDSKDYIANSKAEALEKMFVFIQDLNNENDNNKDSYKTTKIS